MQLQSDYGRAYPLGASRQASLCWNFAVYAPEASQVWLCVYCPDTEELQQQLPFIGRTGDIWHLQVRGIADGSLYGLKTDGALRPEEGLLFSPQRLLIDPYARQLNRALVWNERLYQSASHYMVPKAVLSQQHFDWQGVQKPAIAREKTIIYEAHVKGLTKLHPDIPAEQQGRYLGVCHPVMLEHYKKLGITSIQLLPVTSFMSEPRLEKLKLSNYWGYNPVNFFAPDARYAETDPVTEFKTMVRTLHQHDIEVILDLVFNHSAEGDDYLLSFRGLANRQYYLYESHANMTDYRNNSNFSGCGNTLNVADPMMQRMVLDALRYWATEMQVDGFRFDLAVTLARENKRFEPHAAFLQVVAQDPVLSQVKLIAEPWDVGPYGYQLGQFPAHWSEINDKSRDSFRAYWLPHQGGRAEFATRLMGSRDIFQKHRKPAVCSLNCLTYHDGFTLHDLVCYQDKHNWLNAEQNRDGHNHNLSLNYGVEGPSPDAAILQARYQHKRNLVATLLLSQGLIHWLAGDELSRSQQGNNNAYCQDNDISWLHWSMDYHATQFYGFVCRLIKLRQEFSCLQQLSLLDDQYQLHGAKHKVSWYKPDAELMQDQDWSDASEQSLILVIEQLPSHKELLVVMNPAEQELALELPEHPWRLLLDTSLVTGEPAEAIISQTYQQAGRSLSIWTLNGE
ncbi:glycogen debranching protein GlgX [Rheinheimera marina]|uniref:Glycogen debranching protein GlgX n=1 Tax=Rheinheimera marina TaxID=1774958 RepID=A0ABV9JJI7_9GAMM